MPGPQPRQVIQGDAHASAPVPIRIGVSSCLLGERVRYDGGHKYDAFVCDALAQEFSLVAVCPELEAGFGVPREPVHLAMNGRQVRMIGNLTGVDLTGRMHEYARRRVGELAALELCGYVFKKGSPSCGLAVTTTGAEPNTVAGLFASQLLRSLSALPIEEETALHDERERARFIERVRAYHRLVQLFRGNWTVAELARFHAGEAAVLASRDTAAAAELSRLVTAAEAADREALRDSYVEGFMRALRSPMSLIGEVVR